MRCKTCDYRLWNLVARRCPECGTPFQPSEFEFVHDSVQFCCPHCEAAYYGTGPQGHLVPAEFTCVGCNQLINMDEMILRPTEGLEEEQTKVGQAPWLELRERGVLKAWLTTVGMALVAPVRFIREVPMSSSPLSAWTFAILTTLITFMAWIAPVGVLGYVLSRTAGPPGMGLGMFSCGLLGYGLALTLASLMFLALWGLVAHGLLRISGACSGTLRRTYQALCYSSGANIITATPCAGIYVGWIWWLISAIFMLKEAQKISALRAILATATLPLLSLALLVAIWFWLVFSFTSTATATANTAITTYETQLVTTAVCQYASINNGVGPQHAAQLVGDGHLTAANLLGASFNSTTTNLASVDPTLARLLASSPTTQAQTIQAAVAGMPAGTIAHRLGDYVFTHHGIDPATANGQLWLVVQSPHPGMNPPPQPTDLVTIGLADGTMIQFPHSMLATQLARQNALRAQSNLAPLPNPTTLTTPHVPAP